MQRFIGFANFGSFKVLVPLQQPSRHYSGIKHGNSSAFSTLNPAFTTSAHSLSPWPRTDVGASHKDSGKMQRCFLWPTYPVNSAQQSRITISATSTMGIILRPVRLQLLMSSRVKEHQGRCTVTTIFGKQWYSPSVPILSPQCFVNAVNWEFDQSLRAGHPYDTTTNCPSGCVYVPPWLTLPRHLPAGKLMPLPTLNCPWSHIALDFLTDLPNSDGNTVLLAVMDRFSCSLRLIPLPNFNSIRTGWINIPTCVPLFQATRGHCEWSRPTIHLTSVK